MASRLNLVRRRLDELEADALLLTFLPDIRWAEGFSGSNGVLLVTQDAAHFVTDGRYREQAHQEVQEADIHIPGYALFEYLAEKSLFGNASTCVVDGDHLSVSELDQLRGLADSIRFLPEKHILTRQVASKSEEEIERIARAQSITDKVFSSLLEDIRPGISELDLAAEIVYRHLKMGCERMSFEPIVASGARGALPHARPSTKTIQQDEMVVIDMGGVIEGYASDMTRTVAVGEPGEEARKIYQIVLDAQNRAIDAAQAGLTGKELDAVARTVIDEAGYGEAFSHSLGHGVGLQTHEWPFLSTREDGKLPVGTAVTIEPGIYLEGQFGVRIEDIVVLREGGCDNLTGSTKELLVL